MSRTLALTALLLLAARSAPAQEKVLFSFTYADGEEPSAGLLLDPKGNLFGTAKGGGPHGQGDVFELAHEANGSWTFRIVHAFGSPIQGAVDGSAPRASLIRDAKGNLYGTTYLGGKHGQGTVFELTPEANGTTWSEKILYNFGASATDGMEPLGGVVRDAAGRLYGTTNVGGKYVGGIAFELVPRTGEWTEKILHNFGLGADGFDPSGNLAADAKGNLYGTTLGSGDNGAGTVFELSPTGGSWKETILYPFGILPAGPINPAAGVSFDGAGNLYGTSLHGGASMLYPGFGAVFELMPTAIAPWNEKILHSFSRTATDGNSPMSNLIFDAKGNLYGTTYLGGAHANGTVFELTPAAGAKWTFKILYSFGRNATDERAPIGGVVRDAAGNLYGTTFLGGHDDFGTIFEIVHPKSATAPEDEPTDMDSLP